MVQLSEISLLDLPDLALERIALHLPPSDMANLMLCCAPLCALLRPRMSATVRAKSLGRRWALRATGRALFADAARRYSAWVAASDDDFDRLPHEFHLQDFEARALGVWVSENCLRHVRQCTHFKAALASNAPSLEAVPVRAGSFFYLRALAKSRGFVKIFGMLERVWERAIIGLDKTSWDWGAYEVFRMFIDSETPNFDFRRMIGAYGPSFFPGSAAQIMYMNNTRFGGGGEPYMGLAVAASDFLGAEVLSTLFFLDLAEALHRPSFHNQFLPDPVANLQQRFGLVLDISSERWS